MIRCIAFDYDQTLTEPGAPIDPGLGMRPVSAEAVEVVCAVHARGPRLLLASNTRRPQQRRRALRQTGLLGLFDALVMSAETGAAKPDPAFYAEVIDRAGCAPEQILFVGNHIEHDVTGPIAAGMRAVLIGPHPGPGQLPATAVQLPRLGGLPRLVDRLCD